MLFRSAIMNADPTIHDILTRVDLARRALRTGDYRDLRWAINHLTAFPTIPAGLMVRLAVHGLAPTEAQTALEAVREHEEIFTPAEDGVRRELIDVLTQVALGR